MAAAILKPTPEPSTRARVEDLIYARILFDAVFDEGWKALGGAGLCDDDRKEVVTLAMHAARRRWLIYKAELGTPRQWFRGIVRNELRTLRRRQGRAREEGGDEPVELASEAATLEDTLSDRELVALLLPALRPRERRVVVLFYLEGYTLEEIAMMEQTTVPRAHARKEAGLTRMRKAYQRLGGRRSHRSVAPLPLLGVLLALRRASGAPSAVKEAAWGRFAAELGLDAEPDGEPPDSGVRRRPLHRPQSPRVGTRGLARLLGPVAKAVLGGTVAGFIITMGRCNDPAHEQHPSAGLAVVHEATAPTASPPAPTARLGETVLAATVSTVAPARPGRPVGRSDDRLRAEEALLDKAHWAMETGYYGAALAALAEHARRFPHGRLVALREDIATEACRRSHAHPEATGTPVRCANRP